MVAKGVRSANPPLPTRSSRRTKPAPLAGTPTHASSLTYAAKAVRQVASYAPRLLLQILPDLERRPRTRLAMGLEKMP